MTNEMTILKGGEELPVKFIDGEDGKAFVRQIPIKELELYGSLVQDEVKCIAFVCQQREEWAGTLDRESFTALVEKIDELNLDFYTAWLRRRMSRAEKLQPGTIAAVQRAMAIQIETISISPSAASSPPPPASLA